MWSASALLGLRCPLLLYWSLIPHAGQCVMPICCARASTCFLNCLCSFVLVLLIRVSSSSFVRVLCVLGGGASQRQRDERLHRLTLLSALSFSSLFAFLFVFLCLWIGVCCVVRAQLCEHARNTTHALVFCGFVYRVRCVLLLPQCSVCCPHHTLFIINDRHAHH